MRYKREKRGQKKVQLIPHQIELENNEMMNAVEKNKKIRRKREGIRKSNKLLFLFL